MTVKYEGLCGDDIRDVLANVVSLADETGDEVTSDFNGKLIVASPGDCADKLYQDWQIECELRRIEYSLSPAGQRMLERKRLELISRLKTG